MLPLAHKLGALVTVLLMNVLFFLISPLFGVLALFASVPFTIAVLRQ